MTRRLDSSTTRFSTTMDNRQANQAGRIADGLEDGSLSGAEAARLMRQQNRVAVAERRALADGSISRDEFRNINALQNRGSQSIAQLRHNAETASTHPGRPTGAAGPNITPPPANERTSFDSPSERRAYHVALRQANQAARIAQGLETGELTNSEAATLIRQQRLIAQEEKTAKADGFISTEEVYRLRGMLNMASDTIYHLKHNNERVTPNPVDNGGGGVDDPCECDPVDDGGDTGPVDDCPGGGDDTEGPGTDDPGTGQPETDVAKEFATRQQAMIDQIRQGLLEGKLSQNEASTLLKEQEQLSKLVRTVREDGQVSDPEQQVLTGAFDQFQSSLNAATSNEETGNPWLHTDSTLRQQQQLEKLAAGIGSGQLTGAEAADALEEQSGVAESVGKALANGNVSNYENASLGRLLDRVGPGLDALLTNSTFYP